MNVKVLDYSMDMRILDCDVFQLRYPAHYTYLVEGGGETLGFFLTQPHTIGVLRLSTYTFPNEQAAKDTFERGFINMPKATRIDVNGMECMFFIDEKNFGSNDHLFWVDNGSPMSMYFYSLPLKNHLFCFSYRLPAYMEDDGRFDAEHPVIMQAIGSIHIK